MPRVPRVLFVALAGFFLSAVSGQARAALKFCNDTRTNVDVAIAYVKKDPPGVSTSHSSVMVEGWWTFQPAECATVHSLNTRDHWTYFFARGGGREWRGTSWACTRSSPFTLQDIFRREGERCPAPGWTLRGFRRIDTTAATFTMHLK